MDQRLIWVRFCGQNQVVTHIPWINQLCQFIYFVDLGLAAQNQKQKFVIAAHLKDLILRKLLQLSQPDVFFEFWRFYRAQLSHIRTNIAHEIDFLNLGGI